MTAETHSEAIHPKLCLAHFYLSIRAGSNGDAKPGKRISHARYRWLAFTDQRRTTGQFRLDKGGPILYDQASGNLEVYVVGKNRAVYQKWWNPSHGWSGWNNLGGSVVSNPDAVYDQASGNLEVYVVGKNRAVYQKWWNPSHGWSGWNNLGGGVVSNPDAVYDQASGNLEVYVVGKNRAVYQKWWNPSHGWSGWNNLGGVVLAL